MLVLLLLVEQFDWRLALLRLRRLQPVCHPLPVELSIHGSAALALQTVSNLSFCLVLAELADEFVVLGKEAPLWRLFFRL